MARWLLFSTILIAATLAGDAARALDTVKAQAITRAADAFVALSRGSSRSGAPPRQTEAAARSLLDAVFDVSELQSGKPVEISAIAHLNSWQRALLRVGGVYLFAGTGAADAASLPNDPKTMQTIDQNVARFAPEVGRYVDAQLWIQAAMIGAFETLLLSANPDDLNKPEVRSGLAQVRAGIAQSLGGLIGLLAAERVTDEWRRGRFPGLAAIGLKAATFLLPEDVRRIRDVTLATAGRMSDPTVKAGLTLFATTLSPR
jgi:hypothetical protein